MKRPILKTGTPNSDQFVWSDDKITDRQAIEQAISWLNDFGSARSQFSSTEELLANIQKMFYTQIERELPDYITINY